jgi:hypothetical protein
MDLDTQLHSISRRVRGGKEVTGRRGCGGKGVQGRGRHTAGCTQGVFLQCLCLNVESVCIGSGRTYGW